MTACAVATRCRIRDVWSQWDNRNFDPHSSHIIHPILMKLEIKKDIRITTPHANLVEEDDGKRVCVEKVFSGTFVFYLSIFFCILAHAYRSHQKTDHDRLWFKTRASA